MSDTTERDELAAVIDAAVPHDVTEKARAAVVEVLRPELVEMGMARIDQDDDGDLICDSPEVLDEAARRLANRAVEAVAGLLASHPADVVKMIDELREEFRSDTDEYNGYEVWGALEALRRVRAALTDTEDPAALTGGQP